ncbi:MAG: hypothetical protein ACXVB9_07290 [Bdellovibrionota bacterium]
MHRRWLPLIALALLAGGVFAFWRRAGEKTAQVRSDLEQVCRAQRNYVETRKLMKTVSESELAKERALHFETDVKGSLVREALAEAFHTPSGKRRRSLDRAALSAGIAGWKCPELDQF